MTIHLENLSKRFNREVLYQNINHTFSSDLSTAIIGQNGSGKSTLIQLIAGNQLPSSGKISYEMDGKVMDVENIYSEVTIAAPYLELIEEFTLLEQVKFHFKFKKINSSISIDEIIEDAYFSENRNKQIKNFSSGMKQRLKLMLAFNSDSKILLLDEPTSNLDQKGIEWFNEKFINQAKKVVLLASNQESEYSLCQSQLDLMEYKKY